MLTSLGIHVANLAHSDKPTERFSAGCLLAQKLIFPHSVSGFHIFRFTSRHNRHIMYVLLVYKLSVLNTKYSSRYYLLKQNKGFCVKSLSLDFSPHLHLPNLSLHKAPEQN